MIVFENVTVKFGSFEALRNLNFQIKKGDFMHIVGPNGSGKTTLVKLLVGLLNPSEGNIRRTPCTMGYLPQKMNINQKLPLTVSEIIYSGFPKPKIHPSKDEIALMKHWLNRLEIGDLYNEPIRYLSGGQQQRVYIIRALISNPCLIVLDEPTSALDPAFREKFYELMEEIHQKREATIINVTHDLTDAVREDHCTMYVDQEIRFCGSYTDFTKFEHEGHHHA